MKSITSLRSRVHHFSQYITSFSFTILFPYVDFLFFSIYTCRFYGNKTFKALSTTGTSCETDVDECMSLPCQHNATCADLANSFTCQCVDGFIGVTCETNLDECLSNPCVNLATCLDGVDGYLCECVPGYDGVHCDSDIEECSSLPCQNDGACNDFVNFFECTCPVGFTGEICEVNIDECVSGNSKILH